MQGHGDRCRSRHAAREGKADVVAFDLHGRAQHLDLRRLPRQLKVPAAATDVSADYHVAGTPADLKGEARFEPSTAAGAKIAGGSRVGFSLAGEAVAYNADLTLANLNLQRAGQEFGVTALAADRYKSLINGHVVAEGTGTTPRTMSVTARGTLTDTIVVGGRIPRMSFDAGLTKDTAHVKAAGDFLGFDPAVASGKPAMKGSVGGTLDVDATLANVSQGVTADSVEASGKIALQPSTIGGLQIDRASIDADYHDSTGDIRTLEIVGRDVNVTASGTLALNDAGVSNLKVHADSPSLDQIGTLVEQPVSGIAKIDATITGNRHELRAKGTFTGDGVKYQATGALVVSSDFVDPARPERGRGDRDRGHPRDVRVSGRPEPQQAHREDRVIGGSSTSMRPRNSRSVAPGGGLRAARTRPAECG